MRAKKTGPTPPALYPVFGAHQVSNLDVDALVAVDAVEHQAIVGANVGGRDHVRLRGKAQDVEQVIRVVEQPEAWGARLFHRRLVARVDSSLHEINQRAAQRSYVESSDQFPQYGRDRAMLPALPGIQLIAVRPCREPT